MNALIAVRARRSSGVLGRLAEAETLAEDRRIALHSAIAEAERAVKHGDDVAREVAEAKIDCLLDEARSGRQAADPQAQEPASPVSGFDGGFRGGRRFRPQYAASESADQLFQRAMSQHVAERAERAAD